MAKSRKNYLAQMPADAKIKEMCIRDSPGGMSIGYGMGMMRMAIGVITAGGSLIWTVIVPAFPPPCASHQTIRIPLLAAEA